MEENNCLDGKIVLITGATAGIGLEAARTFASRDAFVIGVGRSPERCRQAQEDILASLPNSQVRYLLADLSIQGEVRRLTENVAGVIKESGHIHLDLLINNAGAYSGHFQRTQDGIEYTFAVNHLAAFLLTHELAPLLAAAPSARVLTLSSGSHRNTWLDLGYLNRPFPYIGLWAYKVTKLANVLFTLELNRRWADTGIRAFAVDPGLVNTEIGLKGTDWLTRTVWNQRRSAGTSPDVPVRTLLHLACLENAPQEIYWYNSHPTHPSRQAMRPNLARKLWTLSEQMCGIYTYPNFGCSTA